MQSKYWCFTLNNPTDAERDLIKTIPVGEGGPFTYIVFGDEVGASGTPHLQGYVECLQRQRVAGIKRLLGQRVHLEKRRGTASQAAAYCKKDGVVYEVGSIPVSAAGSRTDLKVVQDEIRAGASLLDLAEEHFGTFLRYEKSIRSYLGLRAAPRDFPTEVRVYWGATGTGKTRRAYEEAGPDVWFYGSDGWFDGYEGQEHVIFDDFSGSEFRIATLLKLFDRYPMRVRIKGSFVNWRPRIVWITSNLDPMKWYPNAHGEHVAALRRRFASVVHFNEPWPFPIMPQ